LIILNKNIIQRQAIEALLKSNSKQLKANSQRIHSVFKATQHNSKQKMSTSTLAMRIKEVINNMSDTLDTKKEIDEYYKNAMKDIKEKNKEDKKEKKVKKAEPKKRTKKVEVDDEGNEIVKVKRPLNKYQKFIQDNRKKVKEENPEMSGEEIFTLIAELWGKHKEDIKNGVIDDDDNKKDSGEESESDEDIKKDKKEKKVKKEKKEKAPKKEKVDKKAKKESP
jgi:HMG (high mobility group) box